MNLFLKFYLKKVNFFKKKIKINFEVDQYVCLLYTSDAADERSSVDLGGRRIIKKKTQVHIVVHSNIQINLKQHEHIKINN